MVVPVSFPMLIGGTWVTIWNLQLYNAATGNYGLLQLVFDTDTLSNVVNILPSDIESSADVILAAEIGSGYFTVLLPPDARKMFKK